MLYFDASALVKRYLRERGSEDVNNLFLGGQRLFTSVFSYAEILAAFGRKYHAREIDKTTFEQARERFLQDFVLVLHILEMDTGTLAAVRSLVEQHPIRAGDAVQLAAALWLRDMLRLSPSFAAGEQKLEFITNDTQLTGFARQAGLAVLVV